MNRLGKLVAVFFALFVVLLIQPAKAADLVIAMQGAQTATDPHWMTSPRNWTVNHHIYEPLVRRNNKGTGIEPWLATSWKRVDDVTWEFQLRKGVKFHDGTPFTAEDVLFTYQRAPNVPKAPTSFKAYTKYFKTVTAPDPYTVRIVTKAPAPTLLYDMATLLIVSKKNGESATTEDYNSGKAAIGTGAYKFVAFVPNDKTVVKRNADYWGAKEPWDTVTFKMMPNNGARVAALLSGDVDVIESVPTSEIERLKKDPRVVVHSRTTGRIAYVAFDIGPEALETGKIVGIDGQPLKTNPFADKRVRHALRMAIDLKNITERLYQGEAVATGQYLSPTMLGFNPAIKPWKADIAGANKLLKEAGWDGKFKITLAASNATFQNAVKAAEAIAQAWTKAGVPTDVVSMPYPTFLKLRNERKLPIQLMSRQNSPMIAEGFFPSHTHSRGKVKGPLGAGNFVRYENKKVDQLVETALRTLDEKAREKMWQEAGQLAIEDAQINPLWLLNEATATKPNIELIARPDRAIFAMNIRAKSMSVGASKK